MLFGYFTLFVALVISAVAEFYSIVGLMAVFAAAPIPVAIMGAALGVGKITAAVWLKLNWHRAKWTYKFYLIPAVVMLMALTSMGIFGFLSKAHSDQSLVSGDVQSKIAIYDEKIKTAKENIEADRRQLKQMDEAVDQVMARSSDEKGADKANTIRRSQQRDRVALAKSIEANQRLIASLNDEAAPIRAEIRKVEAEVGPIKYIAAMVYGDNPDANLLERAVRWVIILIVVVFDPLALVLILSAQQSIRWAREEQEKEDQKIEEETKELFSELYKEEPEPAPVVEEAVAEPTPSKDPHPTGWMFTEVKEQPKVENIFEKYPYLSKGLNGFGNLKPLVYKQDEQILYKTVSEETPLVYVADVTIPEPIPEPAPESAPVEEVSKFKKIPETAQRHKAEMPTVPEALNVQRLKADNAEHREVKTGFGLQFPQGAVKGDLFLRVDYYPNRLFKYNGDKWIEVDKSINNSYTYDEQYIQYLIEKLESGEYEIDQLSAAEQDLVAEKLQQKNDKT